MLKERKDKMENKKQGPTIIIQFAGPTSAAFNINGTGTISPEQLIAVGEFLSNQARMIWNQRFAEAVMQQRQAQIIVPEGVLKKGGLKQ